MPFAAPTDDPPAGAKRPGHLAGLAGLADPSKSAPWLQVLLGLALSALAVALRWLLDPLLDSRQPYTPAYGAVALAVWFGGWRAAVVALFACQLSANYLFVAPRGQWTFSAIEAVGASTYYAIGGIIIFLGHRARAANQALTDALQRLRDSDRRRTRFLAVLAHELRNPLAAIHPGIELLASDKLSPAQRETTGRIARRQVQQMRHLIDDLLDVARIDQGKIVLQKQQVPVAQLAADALASARAFTDAKGQTIAAAPVDERLVLHVDPDRMNQVLVNLLQNASKFSDPGSGITLLTAAEGREVLLTVRDSGIGIDAERLHSIFEPFVQIGRPGQAEGLGLGLSLVRTFVALHGGSVVAHSEGLGRGASFTVRLPLPPD